MNPIPNQQTTVLIKFLTDRSNGFCIADQLRNKCDRANLTAERLERATVMLLADYLTETPLAWVWRNLLLASLIEGVDWNYVSTVLVADHAHN